MDNMVGIIWIIWTVALLVFFHKIFTVYYFNLSLGLLKELLFAAILGAMMTGLTLYFWWLTAIIIILFGIGTAKKTSSSLALIGCIILAVIIAVMGIRFQKAMKEGEEAESQNIDKSPDTYLEDDMSKDIDYSNKNEMEDNEYDDSWDDIMNRTFETDEMSEYNLSETYMNEKEGIYFKYSNEWEQVDFDELDNYYTGSDQENVIVLMADKSEDISELNECFMVIKLPDNSVTIDELLMDDEEFAQMFAETLDDETSNFETSVIELDGISARAVSFDMEDFTFRMYYYCVNSDLYQISCYGKKDDKYLESYYDAVMDTYTVIAVEHESNAASSDYILENSDSEYLTRSDLEGLSENECILARNELYARHGRRFNSKDIQDYFDMCSWYKGVIEPDDFQETMLNDIEIANRDLIISYEKEMGYQ